MARHPLQDEVPFLSLGSEDSHHGVTISLCFALWELFKVELHLPSLQGIYQNFAFSNGVYTVNFSSVFILRKPWLIVTLFRIS